MARTADPNLKEAVVDAVLPLLDKHGQSALSMRAVAKAAGTTTPTLYSRFKDQDSLLVAITLRVSQELLTRLLLCKSVKEMARQYLRYVSDYPHRYEVSIATTAKGWERNETKPIS